MVFGQYSKENNSKLLGSLTAKSGTALTDYFTPPNFRLEWIGNIGNFSNRDAKP